MIFRIIHIAIFSFTITILSAQSNFSIRAFINPLGASIGKIEVDEKGLGYYDIKIKRPYNYDIGVLISRKIVKNLHLNLGAAFKYDKLKIDYTIPDPFQESEVLLTGDRFIRKYIFSPHLMIELRKPKYYAGVGWEGNIDLHYKTNVIIQEGPVYNYVDPVTMQSAFLYFSEWELSFNDLSRSSSPLINAGYKILPHWYVTLNCRFKPYGNQPFYRLLLEGKMPEMPVRNHILNDVQIWNKWIYTSVGLAYDFSLQNQKS